MSQKYPVIIELSPSEVRKILWKYIGEKFPNFYVGQDWKVEHNRLLKIKFSLHEKGED